MQQDPTIARSGRAQRLIAIICALALAASIAVLAAGPATATGDTTPPKPVDDHQPPRPPGSKKGIPLQILAFNDYHGHLEADTPGEVDGRAAGGAEYLSTVLTRLRRGNENSITVAAGDLVGGSPFFSGLFRDEPSVESLAAMGLDLSGVGNHEFDEGVDELRRLQYGGCHPVDGCFFPDAPYDGAEFTWISSNVVDENGATPLSAYEIREFGGVPVAFIGMTLEATPTLVAQSGIQGFEFLDEVRTANRLVRYLKGHKGIRSFVVLLHEGGIQDDTGGIDTCEGISGPVLDIAARLHPDIDVVVSGHTHQPYNCMLPDRRDRLRPVTSAFSFGRVVSEIDVKLNPRTGNIRRKRTRATNHVVDQGSTRPDPALTAVLDKWRPLSEELGNRPVGEITADIVRGGTPPGDDRGVESPAGNLVADAQLWATEANGAQIALMNPGGVRSDLEFASSSAGEGDGVVTYGEAFTFQPFGNLLFTVPMTGAEIVAVLEEQCQPVGSSRPILHLGVSEGFTYDLATTVGGGDCTSVSVTNAALDGVPLDPAASYLVTINNFLADGGDNFETFATLDPTERIGGGEDLQALIDYLGAEGPVAPPSIDRANELG